MSKKHHHHTDGLTEQEEQDLPVDAQPQTPQEEPAPQPDYYEKYVRLSADFENFRKRTEREKAALLAYGKKDFVEKLLPAYEVMLRQQAHMQKEEADEKGSAQMQSLRAGLNMVLGELKKAFAAERIEKLDVVGKPYDPQTSEAIALVPAPADKDGQVLEEVQMGFSMEGKILRPARVVVGKAEEEAKKQEAETK
ncbi:nucleotide exchange factor GrpE [Candidatus Avelusimicrobium facis]|uniref:nucleotide exchange factor GrpE n=1 Tax=Candidatus Avelusimicrobium facis TaxID=3416203 RepID=UPI0015B52FF5